MRLLSFRELALVWDYKGLSAAAESEKALAELDKKVAAR